MLHVLFLSLYYSLLSINHLSVKIEYLVTKDERELWCPPFEPRFELCNETN